MTETIVITATTAALIGGSVAFLLNEQRRRARIWAADHVWWRERARACRRTAVQLATRPDLEGAPAMFTDILDAYVTQEDEAADRADRLANRAALRIPYYLRERFIEQARRDCEVVP
jgi:hypothetical protein